MQISHYEENHLYIVNVGDNLTIETVGTFNQYLKPLIDNILKENHMRGMILDMKRVSILDSSGIGTICGKLIKLKKINKKLVLCNANKNINDIFTVSGLRSALTIYSSVAEAVAMLGTVEPTVSIDERVIKKPVLPQKPLREKGLENFVDKKSRVVN